MVLVTPRLALEAELGAIAYRSRWSVALCFRGVNWVLGCRHGLSHGANGGRIQVDVALIASLLMSRWSGRAPTTRTSEMRWCYCSGWASATALMAHIDCLHPSAPPPGKN